MRAGKIKKLQACKPDPVCFALVAQNKGGYHLSVPEITNRDQSAYPVPHSAEAEK
jgi:hypothetical protein